MPLTFPVPPKTDQQFAARTISADTHSHNVTVFRNCHQRFQECVEYRDLQSRTLLSELAENYVLDFALTAKRAIGDNPSRYRLFQLRYLEGANRQDCCKTLKLEVFTYTSEIIQIERAVGRALAERGLFPLASYFSPVDLKLKIAA